LGHVIRMGLTREAEKFLEVNQKVEGKWEDPD
jgi:hypothetical protein